MSVGNYDNLFFEAWLFFRFDDETHLVAPFDEFCTEHVDMIFYTSYVWVEEVRYHAARCRLMIVGPVRLPRGTRTRWLIVPFPPASSSGEDELSAKQPSFLFKSIKKKKNDFQV